MKIAGEEEKVMAEATVSAIDFCSLTDAKLVVLAKSGNIKAWEQLVNRYTRLVRRCAKRYFLVGAELEDILQEGMIGLCKAIRDYDETKANSFRAFSELCVTRQMITAIKTATRQKHMPLNSYISLDKPVYDEEAEKTLIDVISESDSYNPERIIIDREDLNGMELKIEKVLSKFEAQVLVRYLQGQSYQDISRILSKDVKAIDNALQRIKRKLEASLVAKT